jgi:hypothetical protein
VRLQNLEKVPLCADKDRVVGTANVVVVDELDRRGKPLTNSDGSARPRIYYVTTLKAGLPVLGPVLSVNLIRRDGLSPVREDPTGRGRSRGHHLQLLFPRCAYRVAFPPAAPAGAVA